MKEIEAYLAQDRPDYQEGIGLLEKFGGTAQQVHQYRNTRPVNGRPFLLKALRDLLKSSKSRYTVQKINHTVQNEIQQPASIQKTSKGREYDTVVDHRRQRYVEMTRLHASLEELATDEQRGQAMDELELLYQENRRLWAELDHYDQHGKWKKGYPLAEQQAEAGPAPTLIEEERYLRNSLRPKISRAEKKLKELTAKEGDESPKVLKLKTEVAVLRAERDALTLKLGL